MTKKKFYTLDSSTVATPFTLWAFSQGGSWGSHLKWFPTFLRTFPEMRWFFCHYASVVLFPIHRLGVGQVTVEAGSPDAALHLFCLFWLNPPVLYQQSSPHHHTSTCMLHSGKHARRNHLVIFFVSHEDMSAGTKDLKVGLIKPKLRPPLVHWVSWPKQVSPACCFSLLLVSKFKVAMCCRSSFHSWLVLARIWITTVVK